MKNLENILKCRSVDFLDKTTRKIKINITVPNRHKKHNNLSYFSRSNMVNESSNQAGNHIHRIIFPIK